MDVLPIIPNAGNQELDESQHVNNILSYHIVYKAFFWKISWLLVNEEIKFKNILFLNYSCSKHSSRMEVSMKMHQEACMQLRDQN